jgi:site-specific DNA recombinase
MKSKTLDIYTRVSRLSDNRMLSTDGQEADCRERVAEARATVGRVHCDPGKSAWDKRVKRPGWDALMARIESGETDGVVVFDLSRFTRRPMEGERLIEAAERGLSVLDSEHEFDLTSADGKASFRDHMKMAAYQSDRMSTTIPRGKRRKARSGEPNISARPFGFEDDGVAQRPEEADALREMATRFLAGESQDVIRADLTQRGILTSYGKPWTRTSFRAVLLRPRNAGHIIYRGEPVSRLPGEPILDQLTYDRVLNLFQSRRGRPASARYVSSGLAVCGQCGHGLTGRPRKNMKPYPDGEERREYWCNPSGGGCRRAAIDQRYLDDWAGDWAIDVLSDQGQQEAIEREDLEREAAREALLSEQASIESELLAVTNRLGEPGWNLARVDLACKRLEGRLGEIRTELQNLATAEPEPIPAGSRPFRHSPHDYAYLTLLAEWSDADDRGDTAKIRALILRALHGRHIVISPGTISKSDAERVTVR